MADKGDDQTRMVEMLSQQLGKVVEMLERISEQLVRLEDIHSELHDIEWHTRETKDALMVEDEDLNGA